MSKRPTIYLGNGAKAYHGPGWKWAAMAKPRAWERGRRCLEAAPSLGAFTAAMDGRISVQQYRGALMLWYGMCGPTLSPGRMLGSTGLNCSEAIRSGDTLTCGCAAPDSPRRKHPCHLEVLAPFLAAAGWDVVLWGEPLGDRSPEDFGWPPVAP